MFPIQHSALKPRDAELIGQFLAHGDYKKVAEDLTSIKTALVQQPCSVAINATARAFSNYRSGVLSVS